MILNSPDLDVQRGSFMIEYIIGFQRSFLPDGISHDELKKFVKPVIVKFQQFKTKSECDYQFDKIISFYEEKIQKQMIYD